MAFTLQICSYLLWFPLEILVISTILRAGVRRYPLIFAFMTVTFLIAVEEVPAAIAYHQSHRRQGHWLEVLHAAGDGIADVLILSIVASLIYGATSRFGARRLTRLALIGGGLLFIGVTFAIHYDSQAAIGVWMTPWSRDLHFCSAVLDLVLWAFLLASRDRNPILLLLAGGMGIMFAGEAMGEAVRSIAIRARSNPTFLAGNLLVTLADCAFLYVWWQTFRQAARQPQALEAKAPAMTGDRTSR